MLSLDKYTARLQALKEEQGISNAEMVETLKEKLKEYPIELKTTKRTYSVWAKGSYFFPPVEVITILATKLDVSVGYLLGQHPIRRFDDNTGFVNINIKKIEKEFKNDTFDILYNNKVNRQWAMSVSKNKFTNTKPFYKLAEVTGYTIDFCLGLTNAKYWQAYAFEKGFYDLLPHNTVFIMPHDDGQDSDFALLNSTAPNSEAVAIVDTGEKISLDEIKKRNGKVVSTVKWYK